MMIRFLGTKIGIALLLAIAIIGISLTYKYTHVAKTVEKTDMALAIEKVIESSLERDEDGDGLKNWEEVLYKTDAKDADSDDDGIKDGDEVNRNNDPLNSSDGQNANVVEAEPIVYTPTDKFSQEIFKEYIAARQAGLEVDEDLSARIAEKVLNQDYKDAEPVYSAGDFMMSQDSSLAGLKSYGNAMGNILNVAPAAPLNELEIVQRLQTEPLERYEKDLLAIKARYEAMKTKLLVLPVPKALLIPHANIANSINTFLGTVDGALTVDSDPIGSLGKISQYMGGIKLLGESIALISGHFKKMSVTFSSTESGYIFR